MTSLQTSFIDLPTLYAFGVQTYVNNNTQIQVSPGQARSQFNEFDIVLPATTFINTQVNGINGLDTGTIAVNTWYSVYLIYDNTLAQPTSCIISAQQKITNIGTAIPVLPFGYSHYRRIGWVLTDSSANLIPYDPAYQFLGVGGDNCARYYQWRSPIQVLGGGTSTTFSTLSLGGAIPYIERGAANLGLLCTGTTISGIASIRPTGSSSAIGLCPINVNSTVTVSATYPQFPSCWIAFQNYNVNNLPSIDYIVTASTLTIWVNGFYDCF